MNPAPSLENLSRLRRGRKAGRVSSWDRSGRNTDWHSIRPGETCVLADLRGPGQVTHLWFAQPFQFREVLLRITYDNASFPSVLCPIGDFFCLGNGLANSFESALFSSSSNHNYAMAYDPGTHAHKQAGCGLNSYVPMPYRERALLELVNEGTEVQRTWYYVDYETFAHDLPPESGYFHAEFRRANPFRGWGPDMRINTPESDIPCKERFAWNNNYVILETKGRGQYIGCNLSVANLCGGWWGEGDDMIWVDGYKWPPDLHGTGSEDYLNHAWGMQPNAFLRNGSSIHENLSKGYQTSYVFHLENPVYFEREIKVTIEAGHGNHLSNDYSSVAYWYAETPAAAIAVPPVEQRRPVFRDAHGVWDLDTPAPCPGPRVELTPEILLEAPEVADALNPVPPVLWTIPRLAPDLTLAQVREALASAEPRAVRVPPQGTELARVRLGVSGNRLAVEAQVNDPAIKRDPHEYWQGSAFEIYGAAATDRRTAQAVFLPPDGNQAAAEALAFRQGCKLPVPPDLLWECQPSDHGYRVTALIPLSALGIGDGAETFCVEAAATIHDRAEGSLLRGALVTSAAGGWQSARRFQTIAVRAL